MQDIQPEVDKAWRHFVEMGDVHLRTNAILALLRMPSEAHTQEIRWILITLTSWLYPKLGNPEEKRLIGGLAFFLYGIVAGRKLAQAEFTCLLNQNTQLQAAFQKNQIHEWLRAVEQLKQLAESPCINSVLDDEKKRISRQSLDAGYHHIQDLLLEELPELAQDPDAYLKKSTLAQTNIGFEGSAEEARILYDLFSAILNGFLQALNAKLSIVLRLILRSFLFFCVAFASYLIFGEVPLLGTAAWLASLTYAGLTGFFVLWFFVQVIWIPASWLDTKLFPDKSA